ncbi:hypothetical protein Val02_24360 [Virgisporangium aliadipatigenens]|uniref:TipAS antibiotic-recognition domain-containing protein n=1 Tax=Virgisporangium aliadipatigenens TaxID=741659 RepID=A0A8J4DP39_9ACTN|nr:TipAS antibiotic-recognition domain-containing protein [Virgisporangium aliadipatigenens]GIJ45550.1 hypothetical protein Val02_24360 [Virgisporangium aliadipatigenens]
MENPYADEARERWGDTDAYRESQRRASTYTPADWERIKAEGAEVSRRLVAALHAGTPADDPAVMELAEEHRRQISRWFYECGYDIHRGLADMYVADPRFTATYEEQAPGLARYLHDAIHANAARAQGSSV